MGADDIRGLLSKLTDRPEDVALRAEAAERMEHARTDARAARTDIDAVLAPLVNLAGHDEDTGLPCLCRDCLARAGATASHEDIEFVRSFVVVGRRVLHFWMLGEQIAERANVRQSVEAALVRRLALPPRRRGGRS